MLVGPLWVAYESLAFRLNAGWGGHTRTGVDFVFKRTFAKLGLWPGFGAFLLLGLLLGVLVQQRHKVGLFFRKPTYFGFAILESVFYALAFGLGVGSLSSVFLSQAMSPVVQSKVAVLVVNLGSGVYEELFFRVGLISVIAALLAKVKLLSRGWRYALAMAVSSAAFAFAHHLPLFHEPLALEAWVFRFLAGVVLAGLFVLRGYGVVAYTHSLYNVFLMFR